MEDQSEGKSDDKVVRQIRMRYSDFADRNPDPFFRYWILCFDLGPIHDPTKNGHLTRIFVDTGANINKDSRIFMICWFIKDLNPNLLEDE